MALERIEFMDAGRLMLGAAPAANLQLACRSPINPVDARERRRVFREDWRYERAWPGQDRLFTLNAAGQVMSAALKMNPTLLMGSGRAGTPTAGSFNAGASGYGIRYQDIVVDGGIITADPAVIDSMRRSGWFIEADAPSP